MLNTKIIAMLAIAATVTLLAANLLAIPALAASSSSSEFHHDTKQFLKCVRENNGKRISRSDFVDCLTNYFNIHISKHTEKHL
jgi:hypothetical protein